MIIDIRSLRAWVAALLGNAVRRGGGLVGSDDRPASHKAERSQRRPGPRRPR